MNQICKNPKHTEAKTVCAGCHDQEHSDLCRYKAALERLASGETFTHPFYINKESQEGAELVARWKFAQDTIQESKGPSTWRPIDTAPRDGGHILIYIPKEDPTRQCVKEAWWSIPYEGALLEQGGWQTMGGVCLSNDIHGLGATYWAPLPSPPISE